MAERTFSAPDGVLWQAWNVNPAEQVDWPAHARKHLPLHLAGGWLCFQSAAEKRRLQPVPRGWDSVTDDELWRYCCAAQAVRRAAAARSG